MEAMDTRNLKTRLAMGALLHGGSGCEFIGEYDPAFGAKDAALVVTHYGMSLDNLAMQHDPHYRCAYEAEQDLRESLGFGSDHDSYYGCSW